MKLSQTGALFNESFVGHGYPLLRAAEKTNRLLFRRCMKWIREGGAIRRGKRFSNAHGGQVVMEPLAAPKTSDVRVGGAIDRRNRPGGPAVAAAENEIDQRIDHGHRGYMSTECTPG